jgi:uncharacterized membrane protein YeaQ/YmgE (transglycosylase-associated protein family)
MLMEAKEVISLIIIGALAGAAASSITGMRTKQQSGWIMTTVIGILGALVGSILFDALKWTPPDILTDQITPAEILTAFVGAVIVIIVASFIQKR